jgi:sugar phosphate isomerase/epimerase
MRLRQEKWTMPFDYSSAGVRMEADRRQVCLMSCYEERGMWQIDRRTMLAGISAMAVSASQEVSALAAPAQNWFEQRELPIGLQVYTLGEDAGRDLDATFGQIAMIGYGELELPNLYGRKPSDVRAAADRAGLKITSIHIPAQGAGSGTLNGRPDEVAEMVKTLGAARAAVPIAPFPADFRPQPGETMQAAIGRSFATAGADHWRRTAALLNEKAAALKPLGVAVGYHNHNIEFAPVDGTTGWEILVRETDPTLVDFEIDTGWIATAGLDPVTFLRGLTGRATQLHVKDVAGGNTTNFALAMKPAEVGAGILDWNAILPAAYDAGVRHFYVEQEPPFTIPRIEAVRRSHHFLAQLHA